MLILLTRLRGRTKIIFKDSLSLYLFIYISIASLVKRDATPLTLT